MNSNYLFKNKLIKYIKMGTRNLTMVIDKEGVKKVAQYGQWDGYPSGVGLSILVFLKDSDLFSKMVENLKKTRFLDLEGVDKEFIEDYNRNAPEWSNEPDNRTKEQIKWFSTYCHRDLAEKVLINIANSDDKEIILMDRESTGRSGGWVEYSYIINLKEGSFGVYNHIDEEPLKVYLLDDLPDEDIFIKELELVEE
jgi:hypothetical protein